MRYWGYFIAKLLVGAAGMLALWKLMHALLPEPVIFMRVRMGGFAQDLTWTLAYLLYWLLAAGLLAFAIWDQRRRCRICLRRLRMPINTGNWGLALLFAPPKLESICPFGHGTLACPETHTSTAQPANWEEHGDIWAELEHMDQRGR
ncbi:MAG: hypothetical protein HXY18_01545 [Bryobacteraceae bacterium]|nr:hypothetical protein [Bryobacteraceae bacterium]